MPASRLAGVPFMPRGQRYFGTTIVRSSAQDPVQLPATVAAPTAAPGVTAATLPPTSSSSPNTVSVLGNPQSHMTGQVGYWGGGPDSNMVQLSKAADSKARSQRGPFMFANNRVTP